MGDVAGSIYDYPLYYDVLFGWDRAPEAAFYDAAFWHHGVPKGGRIVELGCGTGQIAVRLAKLGWHVTGLDKCPAMLEFLEDAANQAGVAVDTVCADMTGFTLAESCRGAYCPMSTFRLLPEDRIALAHLGAVADALTSDGVYILDMAFADPTAPDAQPQFDQWRMRRGDITVSADGDRVSVQDGARGVAIVLDWGEQALREYTSAGFCALVEKSGVLSVVAWYPPAGESVDGATLFDVARSAAPPVVGRAMVVLKRRSL